MRDITPLSQRFDLRYIRRRHWPYTWTRAASLVVVIGLIAYVVARQWVGDEGVFTSGPLTNAHAIFADDCSKCHQPAPQETAAVSFLDRSAKRYWLPAQDSACLACHAAPLHDSRQTMFTGAAHSPHSTGSPIVMASDCRACHVEHRGRDANINAVNDAVCTQCHADLNSFGIDPGAPPLAQRAGASGAAK